MTPHPLFDLWSKWLRQGRDLSRGHLHEELLVESELEEGLWFLCLISPQSSNTFPFVCISLSVGENKLKGTWKLGVQGICVSGQDGESRPVMAVGGLWPYREHSPPDTLPRASLLFYMPAPENPQHSE